MADWPVKNVYVQNIMISNDRYLKTYHITFTISKKLSKADDITRRVDSCGSFHSRNEPFDCL